MYPLYDKYGKPLYVLGIVSSVLKIISLDWNTIFTLSANELSELITQRQYKIHLSWGETNLSRREIQTIIELVKGAHAGEIAEILKLKQTTIESYIVNIKNKLGVSTKSELIQLITSSSLLSQIML